MKKILLACTALAVISAASLHAQDIKLKKGSPQSGDGGEFKIIALNSDLQPFANQSDGDGDFWDSFCLEKNENVGYNTDYWATIGTAAVRGGVGGATDNKDPLSQGTAWLFRQHWNLKGNTGNIGSANYNNSSTAAGNLQNAIWWLEEEQNAISATNPFLLAAKSELDPNNNFTGFDFLRNDATDLFGVRVLNLWNSDPDFIDWNDPSVYSNNGLFAQSQLVVVPEPAAVLGSLFGLGMIGYVGFRRRKAAATQES